MPERVRAVACTRCSDVVEVPEGFETVFCKCGKTFVCRGSDYVTWGGPGRPTEVEPPESD